MEKLRIRTSLSIKGQIEKKRISEHLIQAAAVYFMLVAAFSAYFSVFDIGLPVSQLVLALGGAVLFLLFIMWNQKHQRKRVAFGSIVLILLGTILRKSLLGGIVSYINKFIELYNQYYINSKPTIEAESTEYSAIVALLFLGVIVGLIFYMVLDKKKGLTFTILVAVLPIILSAIVGKMPQSASWWILISSIGFYLLVYRQNQGSGFTKGLMLISGALIGVIVFSTVIQSMIIDYKNLHIESYNKIRTELLDAQEAGLGDWKNNVSDILNPKQEFAGGVSKGKLSKNASVNPTGEVAMEIVMTQQPTDTIYLKAYVASEYTGDSWKEISAGDLSEILPRIGGATKRRELLNEPFRRVAESDYDEFLGELEVPQMTIELVNASREFGYAPYCAEITDEYNVQKDLYIKGNATKMRKYSFYPLSFEGDGYQNYLLGYVYQNVMTSPVYESYGFSEFFDLELGEASELWIDYQEFVKEAYVDKHQDLEQLREYCDSIHRENIEGELTYYFESQCYYSKNPGEMPKDMDFAEGFMFGRQVGFCVHFATAATLVYQMCGYPARYVEGYAVSASAFKRFEDGTYRATVTDECAHAWCEVFDDELGWVAKEFTPASGQVFYPSEGVDVELPEDNLENKELEEENFEDNPQDTEENINNPQTNGENVDNSNKNSVQGGIFPGDSEISGNNDVNNSTWEIGKQILWEVLKIVIIIAFIIIIAILQQRIRRAKRLKSYKQRKENKGVLSIYNAIFELCVFAGFKTSKESEKEKNQELAEQFSQLTEIEWKQIYLWAEMAAFSNRVISKEEQKEMYHLYRRFRIEILKTLSFKKRMWALYIRAL